MWSWRKHARTFPIFFVFAHAGITALELGEPFGFMWLLLGLYWAWGMGEDERG